MTRWCIGIFLGLTALAAAAEEIGIRGWIEDEGGRPLAGATVELRRIPSLWQTARAQLEGHAPPSPAAEVRSGSDGGFRILAPEAGPWRVVVRHEKRLAIARDLKPLIGPTELAAVELSPLAERRVTVKDAAGRPVAGARVAASGLLPESSRAPRHGWRPEVRLGVTDEHGVLMLPTSAEESLTVRTLSGQAYEYTSAFTGGDVAVRLDDRLIPARVVGAAGKPAPQLVALLSEHLALGLTGPEGEIRVPDREWLTGLIFADSAGRAGAVESGRRTGEELLVLTLPPSRRISGRVVDAVSREPIAGAWVWFAGDYQRSGAGGTYSLRLPSAGPTSFAAAASGYLLRRVEVAAGTGAGARSVALVPARALVGRVISGDGEAVSGAEVVARPDRMSAVIRRQLRDLVSVAWVTEPIEVRSRRDGRFRIEGLTPEVGYELRVSRRGFAPRRLVAPTPAAGEPPPEVEIMLGAGATVSGRVLDAERPVAGAEVTLFVPHGQRTPTRDRFGRFEPEGTTTGVDGGFALPDLAAGVYSLRIVAPGLVPRVVPGVEIAKASAAVDLGTLGLDRGMRVLGRVTDARGQGLAGAEATARYSPRLPGPDVEPLAGLSGTDGGFELCGVAPDQPFDVSARLKGYRFARLRAVIFTPVEPLALVLERGVNLGGRVVTGGGEGAAGARVTLYRQTLSWSSSSSLIADAGGRFVFKNQVPGRVTVKVRSELGIVDSLELEIAEVEPPELRFVLEPSPAITPVRGRLTDALGVAVIDAWVHLEPLPIVEHRGKPSRWPPTGPRSGVTDADGRFVLGVEAGDYRLTAEHPDFEALTETVTVEIGAGRELELVFDTRRDHASLSVSGRVTGPDGAGVEGAEVRLMGGKRGSWPGVTSVDGVFALQAEVPGSYTLRVEHPDFVARQTPAFETPATDLRILLERAVSAVVYVEDARGPVTRQIRIQLTDSSGGSVQNLTSQPDAGGRVVLPSLSPGKWFATFDVGQRIQTDIYEIVVPGDPVVVVLP